MNENRAIALCIRHRDPAGFDYLVKKYRRAAYRHALALVANPDDAADICQDAFASAFASLPRLDQLTQFYPWFYRILRNRCLNFLSHRRTVAGHTREAAGMITAVVRDPEAIASGDEEAARIRDCLAALSFEFREILVLKYQREHDYNTLSQLLGIPRGTVMSRLFHARKAFRAAWLERPGIDTQDNGGDTHG